jgi:hypothetical protein
MMKIVALALALIAANPAFAQEQPKVLKTVKIPMASPGASTLYAIDEDDGTVQIDWKAVETLANSKADRTALPIAQLKLAIRDGTWRPMR